MIASAIAKGLGLSGDSLWSRRTEVGDIVFQGPSDIDELHQYTKRKWKG